MSDVLSRREVANNLNSFRTKRFDAVVLSHWDIDHILAVGYYNSDILFSNDMVWIVPDLTILTNTCIRSSAGRLAWYIAEKCLVYFSDNRGLMLPSSLTCDYLELWQGKGIHTKATSYQNSIGILIYIKSKGVSVINNMVTFSTFNHRDINVLLCGDCVYDNIPDNLKKVVYDILVVPHHGSELAIPDLDGKDSAAIICADKYENVTIKKKKGMIKREEKKFPGPNHVLRLIERGFRHIYITKNTGNITFWINS